MQYVTNNPDQALAEFARLEQEIGTFAEDLAAAVGQRVGDRTEATYAEMVDRSAQLHRRVTAMSHSASHAIAQIQRTNATNPDFAPQQDPQIQKLQQVQHHVTHWRGRFASVMTCFERQMIGPNIPLYSEEAGPYDPHQPIFDALGATIRVLDFMANPHSQGDEAEAAGAFSDIRLPAQLFAAHAHAAYRITLAQGLRGETHFIDVGCGGGMKVVMASHFFASCHGLEFDPAYARAAEALIAGTNVRDGQIITADAQTFEGYATYDIVYFFQPMKSDDGLLRLERQIIDHVRQGTILIAPYPGFSFRHEEYGCASLGGALYLAGTSDEEAGIIRRDAERTGLTVEPEARQLPWGTVWRPALKAFAANGFVI